MFLEILQELRAARWADERKQHQNKEAGTANVSITVTPHRSLLLTASNNKTQPK